MMVPPSAAGFDAMNVLLMGGSVFVGRAILERLGAEMGRGPGEGGGLPGGHPSRGRSHDAGARLLGDSPEFRKARDR